MQSLGANADFPGALCYPLRVARRDALLVGGPCREPAKLTHFGQEAHVETLRNFENQNDIFQIWSRGTC